MVSWKAFLTLVPRPFMLKEAIRLLVKSLWIHSENGNKIEGWGPCQNSTNSPLCLHYSYWIIFFHIFAFLSAKRRANTAGNEKKCNCIIAFYILSMWQLFNTCPSLFGRSLYCSSLPPLKAGTPVHDTWKATQYIMNKPMMLVNILIVARLSLNGNWSCWLIH